ncbi:MAG TPA: hypothetical protein VLG47_06540 [Candidatus Saccharimonadales bacterium]|nr:hypothetical protein [Candidatus Saccharimonadales bacterium]
MDDEDEHESEDDVLEESRIGGSSMFHPNTDEEKLEGDYDSPAAPAPGASSSQLDEPATDDGVEEDESYGEAYNEGYSTAATSDNLEEDSDDAPARPLEPEE